MGRVKWLSSFALGAAFAAAILPFWVTYAHALVFAVVAVALAVLSLHEK